MSKSPQKFYYGIVTDTKGFKQYLGRDDNSGGYPYLTASPVIHFDTMYLEAHKNDTYLNQIVSGNRYTLKIYEVDPATNTIKAIQMWRLWAKSLGEKASSDSREADKIAIIRTIIVLVYLVTNIVIVAGIVKHWNDNVQPTTQTVNK